jgi:hypothetical protein
MLRHCNREVRGLQARVWLVLRLLSISADDFGFRSEREWEMLRRQALYGTGMGREEGV